MGRVRKPFRPLLMQRSDPRRVQPLVQHGHISGQLAALSSSGCVCVQMFIPQESASGCGAACTQTTMSDDKKPPVDSKSSPDAPSTPQRLPPTSDINELHARFRADPRFNPPTPSILTRLALLVLVIILFWFGVNMRKELATPPPEVQAMR